MCRPHGTRSLFFICLRTPPAFRASPGFLTIPQSTFSTTPEKLVALFRDKPLEFQPGEKWNYSNSGYVLLGYLIEKISGEPYAKFVQENIFAPLGMKDSGFDSNKTIIPHRAYGYSPGPNSHRKRWFHQHDDSFFGRFPVLNDRRFIAMGTGPVRRQGS